MLGYPSHSTRSYHTQKAKRYASDDIAYAWAKQESPNGRCPASMTFEGRDFYSYATVIAARVEDAGRVAFLVSDETYSSSTSRHMSQVRGAIRFTGEKTFIVPGVDRGSSNLADMPRILRAWQRQIEENVKEAEKAREPKHTRLLIEAYEIYLEMREFAEYFQLSLTDYPFTIPVPELSRCKLVAESMSTKSEWTGFGWEEKQRDGEEIYTRLMALRLGADPSPWMNQKLANSLDAAIAAASVLHNPAAAGNSAAA